jgi:hypothetical protein
MSRLPNQAWLKSWLLQNAQETVVAALQQSDGPKELHLLVSREAAPASEHMRAYNTEAVETPFILQEVAFGSVISTGSANSITMQWPKTPRNGHCSNSMGQVGCAALHKGLHAGKPALFEGVPGCVDACCEVQVGHLQTFIMIWFQKL